LTFSVTLPLVVAILTASPGPYWLDSGEFVTAAWTLGIPHPPGHPLYTESAWPFALVPFGSVALRVHLASALATAASCGVLAWLARRLALWVGATPGTALGVAGLGAGLAASGYALWFQAVRAEVYALHLLTVALASALVVEMELRAQEQRPADPRLLYGLAFVVGLGLTNHHYLMVFWALPSVAFLLARAPWRRVLLSWGGLRACGFGALGLVSYALLPLRAWREPLLNWGDPSTLERFWWVLTAKAFQKSLGKAHEVDLPRLLSDLGGQMARQFHPIGALVGLMTLAWCLSQPKRRGVGLLALGWLVTNLATQSLLNFDPNNPDVHGYFGLSAWWLALLCALAAAVVDQGFWGVRPHLPPRLRPWLEGSLWASLGLTALLAANTARTLPHARLDGFRDVDVINAALLEPLPEGSLLITSHYKTLFNLWYAQGVEGRRPDVQILHRNFLPDGPYVSQLQRRSPALLGLAAEPGRSQKLNLEALRALSAQRPVYLEFDLNVEGELGYFLLPEGLLFRVVPEPQDPGPLPPARVQLQAQYWSSLEAHLRARAPAHVAEWPGGLELETLRYLTWQHYLTSLGLIAGGHPDLARFHADRLAAANPKAPELEQLRGYLTTLEDGLARERAKTQEAPP
jgi:hypothetical protein